MSLERAAAMWLGVLALSACGERSAPPGPAREPDERVEEAPVRDEAHVDEADVDEADVVDPTDGSGACSLGAPMTWLDDAPARGTLAFFLTEARGAVAVVDPAGRATTRALAADGSTDGDAQPLQVAPRASLMGLSSVPDGALLLWTGTCAESAHCVHAQRLDPRATPLDAPVTAALPAPLSTFRRTTSQDRVYLAWAAEGGRRGLEMWTTSGALGRVRRALGTAPASAERPTEILAMAATDDRWVVLWRRGALEDRGSHVYATTESSEHTIEALREALVVEAIALSPAASRGGAGAIGPREPAAVSLVVGFEFSRPHFVVLSGDRDEPTLARELAPAGVVPAPLTERVRAQLDVTSDGLLLSRRDAKGDPLGAPTRVVEGTVGAATVGRHGDGWMVAWIDPADEVVRARRAVCP